MWLFDSDGILLMVLLAAALHELGHLAALYSMGGRLRCLKLSVCGACIEPEPDHPLSCRQEAVLFLAGPAVNMLVSLLCIPTYGRWSGAALFLGCNLLAGGFNLLPAMPLDGGQALFHVLLMTRTPPDAERAVKATTVATAVLLGVGGAALFAASGYNASILVCAVFLVAVLLRSR